jgi:hypothetical protein
LWQHVYKGGGAEGTTLRTARMEEPKCWGYDIFNIDASGTAEKEFSLSEIKGKPYLPFRDGYL